MTLHILRAVESRVARQGGEGNHAHAMQIVKELDTFRQIERVDGRNDRSKQRNYGPGMPR